MLSISCIVSALMVNVHSAWNYEERGNNVTHWKDYFPECGYPRQSPIDFPSDDLNRVCEEPLELDWTSEPAHYAILNSGHSLKAIPFRIDHNGGGDFAGLEVLHHQNDTNIRLRNKFYDTYGSRINKEYCFDSMHWHWGVDSSSGSEHTFGGKSSPLELHLVHYSCDYNLAGDALKEYASGEVRNKYDDDNVLAVIGVMYEIGAPDPVLGKILDEVIINGVKENKGKLYEAPNYVEFYYTEFDVKDMLPPSRDMVSYIGSLTTPPCYETVRWHVLKEKMTVSEQQLEMFRQLLEGTDPTQTQSPNFRPPQPLNGRTIYACQEDVADDIIREEIEDISVVVVEEGEVVDSQWRNIGIIFIALFGVVAIMCIALSCYVCTKFNFSVSRKSSAYEQTGDQ